MAVVVSGAMSGVLEGGATRVELRSIVDRDLARAVRHAMEDAAVPIVGVSYGANDAAAAVTPMDWATQIPIHFMGGRSDPPVPIVMVAPARDLPWDMHVVAGRAIAQAASKSGKRVALIASCDHGHAHDPKGPYGFSPASKVFDDRVVELVKRNALGEILSMLHGAIGSAWRADFLSYEAPTYFGMRCASFTPPD